MPLYVFQYWHVLHSFNRIQCTRPFQSKCMNLKSEQIGKDLLPPSNQTGIETKIITIPTVYIHISKQTFINSSLHQRKEKKNVDFFSVNIFLAKVIKKIVMNWCKLRYFMASTQPFVTPFVSVVSYWLTANALIYGLLILLHHTIYWVYLHCLHKWMDFICIICWCLIRQFKCYMMILSVQSIHLPQYITNGICHCLPLNFFEFPLM